MANVVPLAFLSHSSADRDLATRIANDLRRNGIDAWFDEWEIGPGDSLRRKIDEGIDRATHFLPLLTPHSLVSEWVLTELDAGMVRRIRGMCRLVPLLHEIGSDDVPATLQGIKWIRFDSYDAALRELVAAIHEVSSKPPLGSAPNWAARPIPALGLSATAQRLAVLLAERSKEGLPLNSMLSANIVRDSLTLTDAELAMAADELNDRSWVRITKERPTGPAGFARIGPTAELFFAVDPHVKGWSPETDAKQLAAAIVNTGDAHPSVEPIALTLAWDPRRFNPAIYFLDVRGHIHPLREAGSFPYAFHRVGVTAKTRRFALGAE